MHCIKSMSLLPLVLSLIPCPINTYFYKKNKTTAINTKNIAWSHIREAMQYNHNNILQLVFPRE